MFRKKKYKIYLFRHGKTDFNRDGRFTGWLDSKLTAEGKRNARDVARQLKGNQIDIAVCTRLSRSKDTLKEVLRLHPECQVILEDDRMIERSYGDLEGETHKGFIERVGRQEVDLKMHGDAVVSFDKENLKKVERFFGEKEYDVIHRGYNTPALNGESFADVEKRVRSFIKDLKKFMRKNKVNVAISAHGNSIRLFRKIMERAHRKSVVRWFIPYDKVYTYSV
jgi:2,3-bisphosphoglycerate-dependent phosphoglycerate mutase